MKKILLIGLMAATMHLVACQSPAQHSETTIQNISAAEVNNKLSTNAQTQLIDVRTPEEFAGGHLKNALNFNYNATDFEEQLTKLDKNKPVLVYCQSGGRSSRAANKMLEMGFINVYNMDGGIMKWNNASLPIEKGAAPTASKGITLAEFNKMVAGNNYVLVDFNAKWCGPCKKMLPVLDALAEKKKDKMSLIKIDADENKELMMQKNISEIPYLELYNNGNLIWKHSGFIDEYQLLKETGI
ncbi:MAG: thioredoxin [Taibaiella sp.]|nr:thioredoxin [Taibaiella sp.]